MRCSKFQIAAITALLLLLIVQPHEASRILDEEEEQWMIKRDQNLLLPSFQRGRPTGPPAPSGCTWVPGSGGKPCTASINQRNFAGHSTPAAMDAYPKRMDVQFGVAAQTK